MAVQTHQALANIQRVRQMIFKALSTWYWPASAEKAAFVEQQLLSGVDLKVEDVPISQRTSSFIHCAYNKEGRRELPVVMAHGLGAGLAFFYKNFTPLIDDGWKVYAFDWLGMGRSGRPAFPHYPQNSVETIVQFFIDSMDEWRERMGLQRFILVGHSLGGYLSCLYALKYPNRVACLILSSPVGLPHNHNAADMTKEGRVHAVTGHEVPGWLVALWNKNFTPQSFVRGVGPVGPRLAHGYVNARFNYLPDAERILLGEYLYQISADNGSGEYALSGILSPGAWAREPLHDRLRSLSMPCHFLYGDRDWMDYKHAVHASQSMTVKTSIVRVSDAGHHLYIDNADEYNRVVLNMLKQF